MVHQYLASVIVQSNSNDKFVRLVNGVRMDFWSLDDPDSARGFQYGFAVVDEAAKVAKLEQALQYTILPTLLIPQGHLLLLSTPRGRDYWYYLCNRHHEDPNWSHMVAATGDNPYVNPDDIEGMKRDRTPRAFKQEVMAEFLDNEGAVFRNIAACILAPLDATPADHEGHQLIMAADWGKQNDYTVVVVLDATTCTMVDFDRMNRIDYAVQTERLRVMAERWNVSNIVAERNSMGEPLIEQLSRDGLPVTGFQTTAQSKAQAIDALALAFER
jgi:phage terminase large subunit-like protein